VIRINMLPWREARRAQRRRDFFVMAGLSAGIGAILGFLGYLVLSNQVTTQEARNSYLKTEMAALDKQIQEIRGLQEQTDALLSRKRVIENLQANRTETVYLFNVLARETPEGIYLDSLRQTGDKITLNGFAQSNARISAYMRNLDISPLLERPELIQSRLAKVGTRTLFEFSLNVYLTRVETEEDKKKAGRKNPAKGGA
jgi:type IV pilus assembly protein PilN